MTAGNDVTFTAVENVHNRLVQKLLEVSLAANIQKIRDSDGRGIFDEVVNILHRVEIIMSVFKGFVRCSRECEDNTEEVIKENNDV